MTAYIAKVGNNSLLKWSTHTHHRSHIFYWWTHTRDFPSAGRSSLDIWFCRPGGGRWSPGTASPCPHSHPETGSCSPEGSLHIQTASAGHSTARGCHLQDEGHTSGPLIGTKPTTSSLSYYFLRDLTTNLERGLQLQKDGLTEEDLPGFQTQSSNLVFL